MTDIPFEHWQEVSDPDCHRPPLEFLFCDYDLFIAIMDAIHSVFIRCCFRPVIKSHFLNGTIRVRFWSEP